jgi:hypothetical protein
VAVARRRVDRRVGRQAGRQPGGGCGGGNVGCSAPPFWVLKTGEVLSAAKVTVLMRLSMICGCCEEIDGTGSLVNGILVPCHGK